jgi:hypothetical protein
LNSRTSALSQTRRLTFLLAATFSSYGNCRAPIARRVAPGH